MHHRPPALPGWNEFDYFAAAGAGVAGVVAAGLLAFLFFFTCFFVVVGVELSVGAAAVCAASDNPAVASVRENPSNTAEIFFMVFVRFLCRGVFLPL